MNRTFPIAFALLSTALLGHAQQATPTVRQKVFRSTEEVISVSPASISLRQIGQLNQAATEQANVTLKREALYQRATLRVRAGEVKKYKGGYDPGFVIRVPDFKVSPGGTAIPVRLWLYFPEDAAASLAKVSKGTEILVSGVIRRADFTTNNGLHFNFDLVGCRVVLK